MKRLVELAILLATVIPTFGEKKRYDNYRVYSTKIETELQLEILKQLEYFPSGSVFLKPAASVGKNAEIMVPPNELDDLLDFFEQYNIKYTVICENVQEYGRVKSINIFLLLKIQFLSL